MKNRIPGTTLVKGLIPIGLFLYFVTISLLKLDNNQPFWWDEGWTLTVARNWVERGHYGLYLMGEPYSAGLSAAFPVVAPIALSFKMLGVGLWQGRFFGVLATFGALGLIGFLALKLYNRLVALSTWFVLILLYGAGMMSPLFWGRQVLGEMPMLFYTLAGYTLLYMAVKKSDWILLPTAIVFGIAIDSKAQILPFWLISMLVPMVIAGIKSWWPLFKQFGIVFVGALFIYWSIPTIQKWIIGPSYIPTEPLPGLYNVTAYVPVFFVRKIALRLVGIYGVPSLLGLILCSWQALHNLKKRNVTIDKNQEILRIALLSLAGSWFIWYITLAMWWERYLFPAVFLSSVFLSVLLCTLTRNFNFTLALRDMSGTFKKSGSMRSRLWLFLYSTTQLAVFAYLGFSAILSVIDSAVIFLSPSPTKPQEAAQYLDSLSPKDALIETAESELFFFMDRPYHFPPDNLHIEWNYTSYLGQEREVYYNPLDFNPQYLVLGHFSQDMHQGRIYSKYIDEGYFKLIAKFPGYQIYERVR